MGMKVKQETIGAPTKNILAIPDHYVALAHTVKADHASLVEVDGVKTLKAGTFYPANDATAIGVVLDNHVFVDGFDKQVAIIMHGFIQEEAIPAKATAEAKAALPMIKFVSKRSK